MKLKTKPILICLFVCLLFNTIESADLKLIKEIGDDDNVMFQRLKGGVLGPEKNIYILDIKGHYLAKYDWNGKFIKRIGRKGQGPNDLNNPTYLDIYDNKLYLLDWGNSRVAETDLELSEFKYDKLPNGNRFFGYFYIIGKNRYAGASFPDAWSEKHYTIRIINSSPLTDNMFFEHTSFKSPGGKIPSASFMYARSCLGVNRQDKQLVITNRYPNNPITFFIYSFDGECLDQFSISVDENYRLPDFIIKGQRRPDKFSTMMVLSIFVHKNHYIAVVGRFQYKKRRPVLDKNKRDMLIIDKKTNTLKHRLDMPPNLESFWLSKDGYLLGTDNYADELKLYIYKLNL